MSEQERPADALVVFGITGDLARKMTLRSLYRLERRGLLRCPVIGVAAADWSVHRLRDTPGTRSAPTASSSTRGRLTVRQAARLRERGFRRRSNLPARGPGARRCRAPDLLSRDPAVAVRHGHRRSGEGRAAPP